MEFSNDLRRHRLNADGEWDLRALPYELAESIGRAFGHTAGQREKPTPSGR